MNKIKGITIPIYLMFVLNFGGSLSTSEPSDSIKSYIYQKVDLNENYHSINESRLVDCTVTIKTDGMELEVTFHDVSRFRCALIKIGKWFQDTF